MSGTYAWQWSGDKPDRFAATPVHVTAGTTTTLDAQLKSAGKVTGQVFGSKVPWYYVSVNAINAVTGDWAGPDGLVKSTGEYELSGFATQDIKISFIATHHDSDWYPEPVPVVAGSISMHPVTSWVFLGVACRVGPRIFISRSQTTGNPSGLRIPLPVEEISRHSQPGST